ncbi:PLP-dependent decarboxylase [Psychrobium sp. 1_MG-2023]|nr:PLP-dependent decarboxylase [Psychrobium sp. 1_MG-2023]MDP2561845.1 PLP-dependent decarboxylase [Psychrobium sp. 1_MG-2023]
MPTPLREQLAEFSASQQVPFFVYDLDGLSKHIASLASDEIKLWFAVKANPLSRVIQTLDKQGMNFDVASTGELEQVLAQGIGSDRILNTGPAKSRQQLSHFLQRGVNTFVVESVNQLALLNELSQSHNKRPQVLLRVQLRFEQGDDNPLGGNSLTPFGLGAQEWSEICLADYPEVDVVGLHIFQWGNMLDADKLISLWQAMIAPLTALAQALDFELKVLDLGGGLGIPYHESEQQLLWPYLAGALSEIKRQAKVNELWLELGRFAVGEYGYYVSEVIDRKTNYEQELLVLQGGINHLLRPAITDQPFPVSLLRDSAESAQSFHIHGPLCTSLDKLGELPLPKDVSVGDQLVFAQCGAYGFTEAMPFFLCHELPAEVVFSQGRFEVVRQAQPASSYLC